MDTEAYMDEVLRTYAGSDGMEDQLNLGALGLAGEAGEVVEHVKKFLYQGHALDANGLVGEIGDVLWYVALLCHALGITLDGAMAVNVRKLRSRYPGGFDADRSVNRCG